MAARRAKSEARPEVGGPAGPAERVTLRPGWAIKSVARRPLKMLLAVALEPLLAKLANRLARGMK